MLLVPVGIALLAALFFAVSATLQQSAARAATLRRPASERKRWLPILGVLLPLLRNRIWVAGWAINVVGFILHAFALHYGSITVVQAVLVTQLIMALGLTSVMRHHRPVVRDWWAAASVCAGLALLITLRGTVEQSVPYTGRIVGAIVVSVLLVGTLLTLARLARARTQVRGALVAMGAGTCFTTTAIQVVVITDQIARQGPFGLLSWHLLVLIGSAIAGSLLVQDSFASGSLTTALTTMTITDPTLSCIAGVFLFDAVRPRGWVEIGGLALSAVLVVSGVRVLANSPTLHLTAAPEPAVEPASEAGPELGPDRLVRPRTPESLADLGQNRGL